MSLKFPSAYRVAKADTNFVWIRRDIETGSVNLFIHRQTNLTEQSIIEKRDSISKIYIPGPVENTHMSTDLIYTPNTQRLTWEGSRCLKLEGYGKLRVSLWQAHF